MKPCTEFLPLLEDRAAGALSPADAGRLEPHLASCAACRREAAALAETLALASLPPPAAAEVAALDGLAGRVRRAQQAREWTPLRPARVAVGLLAVAAAAAFLVAPAFTRHAPRGATAAAAAETEWESPDPDDVWSATALAFDDGAAAMADADELELDAFVADDP